MGQVCMPVISATWEAEAEEGLTLRPVWNTEWDSVSKNKIQYETQADIQTPQMKCGYCIIKI